MRDNYREVSFYKYCEQCKYEKLPENEWPCFECLDNTWNEDTDKPINYEAKDSVK